MKTAGFLCAPWRILTMVVAVATLNTTEMASAQTRPETFISIGTGEMTAVYYLVGKALCQAVFRELRRQGIWCSSETTPGSAYNVEHVVSGELEFAIVQSDIAFAAYRGIGRWNHRPVTALRSVLSLFPELVTVVARTNANIHALPDLAGKRVSVGGPVTGPRTTWNLMSPDLDLTNPVRLTELRQNETTVSLCDGAVDANFFVVGHPSKLVAGWLAACPSNLVAVDGPVVDKLIRKYPFYTRGFIAAQLYHVPDRVPSFGPVATLVTSAAADPRVVAALAKAIVAHVGELKTLHPVLAELDAGQMVARSRKAPAPLHPAAAAVYERLGLPK